MEEKTKICPFCNKIINISDGHHKKNCNGYKIFIENNTQSIIEKYSKGFYSILELSKEYNVTYCTVQKILKDNHIPLRGVSESVNTDRAKSLYKKTMLKNWGCTHNFQKECDSRKKWEQRLFEEEGITNVFQRQEVKEKIKNTIESRYDENTRHYNYAKGSSLDYWINKLGEEDGKQKFQEIAKNKGKSNTLSYYIDKYGEKCGKALYEEHIRNICIKSAKGYHTSINERLNKILKENCFAFQREFTIQREDDPQKYFSYDFLVDNKLIIEMNGVFWHAKPELYKKNDILHFPGRWVIAQDVWKKDAIKKELSFSKGYKFIVLWEDDFKKMTEEEILNIIRNELG